MKLTILINNNYCMKNSPHLFMAAYMSELQFNKDHKLKLRSLEPVSMLPSDAQILEGSAPQRCSCTSKTSEEEEKCVTSAILR